MPIDVVQWRARIGLFHSEGAYREMKRRCGCKHQKIRIRSLVGDSSFVVAVALLALELVRALARIVLQLQWKFLCHTSRCGYSNGKPSLSRKSISRAKPGLIADLPSLSAVCLVTLHSVVRMLLIMSGDVEQNPGPTILSVGDLPTLTNILEGAASKWMTIGNQLGVAYDELRSIQSNPQCIVVGDQGCFQELLAKWLKWAPPNHELPTLEKLALALRSAGEERLAYDLPQKYREKKENLTQASTSMSSSSPSSDEHSLPNVKVRNQGTCMYPEDSIEATTKRNVAVMRIRFTDLLDYTAEKLQQKLEKKEISIKTFHRTLTGMFAPAKCIPKCSDIDEIFHAITENQLWDYWNYYELETIIEKYGKDDKEMTRKITEYKQALAGFKATTKIVDWMQIHSEELQEDGDSELATPPAKRKRLARHDPDYFRKLEMKLKERFTDRTLEYVDDLWESVSDCCLLPRLTVLLDKIHHGCISISWLVQLHVVPQLIEKGRQCTEFFREHEIIRVVVDDECIYEEKIYEEKSITEAETPTMPVKNAKPIELSAVQKEVDVEKEANETLLVESELRAQEQESQKLPGMQKEVETKESENEQLTQSIENLESQEQSLTDQLEGEMKELTLLREELSATQKELSAVKVEHKVQKAANESLQQQLVESEWRAQEAECESQQAKQESQQTNQQLQTVQGERDELTAAVELRDKLLDWERKELEEHKRSTSQLRSAVTRQKEELEHLREENIQLQQRIHDSEAKHESLQKQLAESELRTREAEHELQQAKQQLQAAQMENDELTAAVQRRYKRKDSVTSASTDSGISVTSDGLRQASVDYDLTECQHPTPITDSKLPLDQLPKRKESDRQPISLSSCIRWEYHAPFRNCRGASTVHESTAFFNGFNSNTIYSYHIGNKVWDSLPPCPVKQFGLEVINGLVTTVGGCPSTYAYEISIKTLYTLIDLEWKEVFPPMPTSHYQPATALAQGGKLLIVAGGRGTSSVEILNTETKKWSTATPLSQVFRHMSAAMCSDKLYLVGGYIKLDRATNKAFTCKVSDLLESSSHPKTVWKSIADAPLVAATCAAVKGEILAIGGRHGLRLGSIPRPSSNIYRYDPNSNSWELIGCLPSPRFWPFVNALPGGKLMVVGGCLFNFGNMTFDYTNIVDIGNLAQ